MGAETSSNTKKASRTHSLGLGTPVTSETSFKDQLTEILKKLTQHYALTENMFNEIKVLRKCATHQAEALQHSREEIKALKRVIKSSSLLPDYVDENLSKIPPLPLATENDLQGLEAILEDPQQEEILVNRLSRLGGLKSSSCIYNIMNYLLRKSVALNYSLKGKFTKAPFIKLKIYRIIMSKLLDLIYM
jgi:hypothetical protein